MSETKQNDHMVPLEQYEDRIRREERERIGEEQKRLLEVADWLMHLYKGVSKNGGYPTPKEWEDAYEKLGDVIDAIRAMKEQDG